MRFVILKEFRGGDPAEYLRNAFTAVLRNLSTGLTQLTFDENFSSFVAENVSIASGSEVAIENRLANGVIPRWRVIVRQSGGGAIIDGDTEWGSSFVYLKNLGPGTATVTAIFFR